MRPPTFSVTVRFQGRTAKVKIVAPEPAADSRIVVDYLIDGDVAYTNEVGHPDFLDEAVSTAAMVALRELVEA